MALENPLKLDQGFVVKSDQGNIFKLDFSEIQCPSNRINGEIGVMLFSRKGLFIGSSNGNAILKQADRGVMIEAGEAEDVHAFHITGLRACVMYVLH